MTHDSSTGRPRSRRQEPALDDAPRCGVNCIRGSPVRRVNDAEAVMIKGGMTDGEKTVLARPRQRNRTATQRRGREDRATHQHFSQRRRRRRRTEMKEVKSRSPAHTCKMCR